METHEALPTVQELARAFGQYLRELLDKQELSDKVIAEKIGVSPTAMWGMTSGRLALPSTEKLIQLAEILGANVDDFLSRAGRIRPSRLKALWSSGGMLGLMGASGLSQEAAKQLQVRVLAELSEHEADRASKVPK